MKENKIAIIHDWLTGMRGGEKCLEAFCEIFPDADIFTLFHKKGAVSEVIEKMPIKTSFLQKVPGIFKRYRYFLPIFPMAIESFDLKGYDFVLSSSHCVAKGVKVPRGSLHICYCHTPVRYAWEFFDEYFGAYGPVKKKVIGIILNFIKKWDFDTAERVKYFIANSYNVKNRIKKYYKRDAAVIYPPVNAGKSLNSAPPVKEQYYLVVSSLVPYKRIDIAVKAFNKNGKNLVVAGSGPDMERLRAMAHGNIEFTGWISDAGLADYYSGAKALIFPGEEDSGIAHLEAQSYGKAVIAYGRGGLTETVVPLYDENGMKNSDDPTGIFFYKQEEDELNATITRFEKNEHFFKPMVMRNNSLRFTKERFKDEILRYIVDKAKFHKLDLQVEGHENTE